MEGPAISTPPHNLPAQLIPIVGREKEIGDLTDLISNPEIRLITLHGFGGTGKTRLAIETGRTVLDLFPDGGWFIALAPLNSPDYIISTIASAIGFSFQGPEDQKDQIIHFLRNKKLLLIFDNLEHLLPGGIAYIEEILQNTFETKLLITSRHPINAPWEWVYSLYGLEYETGSSLVTGEIPTAVKFFLQHLSRAGAPSAESDLGCAAQICQIVKGLPLALLLAASWGRALGCNEIFHEIKRGIGFLHAWQQTFPEKHSSMQAVFDYSWRLLSDREQAALRKLSVFRGGFDRKAAAEVAEVHLPLLANLVDQSLLERISKDRYQIHELLRQYLQEQLVEAGEEKFARDQHLAYYARLAEQAKPELVGEHLYTWIQWFTSEIDNIRAALEWSLVSQEVAILQKGLRLMVSSGRLWRLHAFLKEGLAFLNRFLAVPSARLGQHLYGEGLSLAMVLSTQLMDYGEARRLANEVLQIGLELNDPELVGDAYYYQGRETFKREDLSTSHSLAEQALEIYQRIDDPLRIAFALTLLGENEMLSKDFAAAYTHLTKALEIERKLKDEISIPTLLISLVALSINDPDIGLPKARSWIEEGLHYARKFNNITHIQFMSANLGEILRLEGRYDEAALLLEETLQTINEIVPKEEFIFLRLNLGFVYSRVGKHESSKKIFLESLVELQKLDHLVYEWAYSLLGLAGLAVVEGKSQLAARILGALDSHKEQLLFWPTDKNEYDRILTSVQAQLTEKQFNQLYKEGQALSLADASQLVQSQGKKGEERLNQLTNREIEILRLVAQGLSDAQVAEQLVLSPRTVNAHLTSIYNKLGVNSRVAATRFAIEKGLV